MLDSIDEPELGLRVGAMGLPPWVGAWNPFKVIAECIACWRAETTKRQREDHAYCLKLLEQMPPDQRATYAAWLLITSHNSKRHAAGGIVDLGMIETRVRHASLTTNPAVLHVQPLDAPGIAGAQVED